MTSIHLKITHSLTPSLLAEQLNHKHRSLCFQIVFPVTHALLLASALSSRSFVSPYCLLSLVAWLLLTTIYYICSFYTCSCAPFSFLAVFSPFWYSRTYSCYLRILLCSRLCLYFTILCFLDHPFSPLPLYSLSPFSWSLFSSRWLFCIFCSSFCDYWPLFWFFSAFFLHNWAFVLLCSLQSHNLCSSFHSIFPCHTFLLYAISALQQETHQREMPRKYKILLTLT